MSGKIITRNSYEQCPDLGWDQPMPDNIAEEWRQFSQQLRAINSVKFPRASVQRDTSIIDLIVFSDGSDLGFGATVYTRSISSSGAVQSRLLAAKAKVGPQQKVSIPRMG